MANRRMLLAAVLVVVVVIVLAGVAVYYLTLPPGRGGPPLSTSTCTGTAVYNGTVWNDTQVPVQGAVVSLAATLPNTGTYANVTTGGNGTWSATVSGVCPYTARVYWQSAVDSPLLAEAVNVTASWTTQVHVSWENVTLTLMSEFPHTADAPVTVSVPLGFAFFVQANRTGSIPLGFLEQDASGNHGYHFTQDNSSSVYTGLAPYAVIRPAARAYRVEDMNGSSVVYAVPRLKALFGSVGITDPLDMTGAIAQVQARGEIPYVQVAPHGSDGRSYNVTNVTHMLVGETTGVLGVSLLTYVTVPANSTAELGIRVEITNTTNRTQCYVVDPEGPHIHTWYYGVGACP